MSPSTRKAHPTLLQRALVMACLIIVGEVIFGLPFHVARFFRPTVLAVLDLTNTELGVAQAVYGVTAMLAYFPGGPLADRFAARKLLALSLGSTAVGGVYYATFPPYGGMAVLFGYWGFTTILLFWAALIRSTRDWGGPDEQGRAYGILDSGRGLFAAAMASGAALLFTLVFPADANAVTNEIRAEALRAVIYCYAAVTAAAAALAWFFIPDTETSRIPTESEPTKRTRSALLQHVLAVLRRPAVWLQAIIVLSAYVAYKGFDNYPLYAHQAWDMDEVEVSAFAARMQWVRPVAALAAGVLGDFFGCSRLVIACFVTLIGTNAYFAISAPQPDAAWILFGNVAVTCAAMFGLRGLYFALFEEARIPTTVTGTAVGIISVIGYTPDIFVNVVGGVLLDASPGLAGHQHFFWFLTAFAVVGLLAALAFRRFRPARDASL